MLFMFIEDESKTKPKPKIAQKRSSKSLLKSQEPKKPKEPKIVSEPETVIPQTEDVCVEDNEEKTKETSLPVLPNEFGTENIPHEELDSEPSIEDDYDPESGTKLSQFHDKCRKQFGRIPHYTGDKKWLC